MAECSYVMQNTLAGDLLLIAGDNGLKEIRFLDVNSMEGNEEIPAALAECVRQLGEYFQGRRTVFDLPLDPCGTEFQKQVWTQVARVPFGSLASYGQIARELSRPKAVRAVGQANAKNPIPIIIPCHRIIGSGGRLTGYSGGLNRKAALLTLEGHSLDASPGERALA